MKLAVLVILLVCTNLYHIINNNREGLLNFFFNVAPQTYNPTQLPYGSFFNSWQTPSKTNYAVKLGFPVTASSVLNGQHFNYMLDSQVADGHAGSWSALTNDPNQWIQVSTLEPKVWTTIITQGRQNLDQWITQFYVEYSNDGQVWHLVDDGRRFEANKDRNTQVTHKFEASVKARTLRIRPTSWYGHISLRFEALFEENSTNI